MIPQVKEIFRSHFELVEIGGREEKSQRELRNTIVKIQAFAIV
jgi:hypothetical protein